MVSVHVPLGPVVSTMVHHTLRFFCPSCKVTKILEEFKKQRFQKKWICICFL